MIYFLIVFEKVAFTLVLLASFTYFVYMIFTIRKTNKEREQRLDGIAERLLAKADDDKPIMLNVSQERLIEKVVEEIERRSSRERM